ncbi:hypothetical protein LSAT2_021609 [Lamellibrachia satsuma]|nr:hypothetical protein LSAT2_021609 [Lamellibrachia satsuma]
MKAWKSLETYNQLTSGWISDVAVFVEKVGGLGENTFGGFGRRVEKNNECTGSGDRLRDGYSTTTTTRKTIIIMAAGCESRRVSGAASSGSCTVKLDAQMRYIKSEQGSKFLGRPPFFGNTVGFTVDDRMPCFAEGCTEVHDEEYRRQRVPVWSTDCRVEWDKQGVVNPDEPPAARLIFDSCPCWASDLSSFCSTPVHTSSETCFSKTSLDMSATSLKSSADPPLGPTTGDPTPQSNHRRSDPAVQPLEIRPRGTTIGDPTPRYNHWRSDPAVQPSEIRPRGTTIRNATQRSNHRRFGPTTGEPFSTVWPPDNHSLCYGYRGATLCGTTTGEPIYGTAIEKPLSAARPPGSPLSTTRSQRSRSRRQDRWGTAFDDKCTGEPLSTVRSPGSRSRRQRHPGPAVDRW